MKITLKNLRSGNIKIISRNEITRKIGQALVKSAKISEEKSLLKKAYKSSIKKLKERNG